jgi:hypothetical protein
MITSIHSSAPHVYAAAEWAPENGQPLVLHKSDLLELGLRGWEPGESKFAAERDTLCYFQRGTASVRGEDGERFEVSPGTAVHFKEGWRGAVQASTTLTASYMSCSGGPAAQTPILRQVMTAAPLKDWGVVPTMLEGTSRTAGILLSREANGRAETGIWTCTPGVWRCEVTSDEFCHFLDGECVYIHESGEQIEIRPDTLAYFPMGWKGTCNIARTMRKVYMIR